MRGTYCRGPIRWILGIFGYVCNPLLRIFFRPLTPVLRRGELDLRWWPTEAAGYRIAFASDLHIESGPPGRNMLLATVQMLLDTEPDLILLGGDFVNSLYGADNLGLDEYGAVLRRLRAPDGVFAVLGNHDRRHHPARIKAMLKSAGVRLLSDRCCKIRGRKARFRLAGFSFPVIKKRQIVRILPPPDCPEPIIAFAHHPDIFAKLPRRVRLLFCGHTHGGQVRLPGFGSLFAGCERGRRRNLGIFRETGRVLVISGGIGCSTLSVRIGCRPEISLITLCGKEEKSSGLSES